MNRRFHIIAMFTIFSLFCYACTKSGGNTSNGNSSNSSNSASSHTAPSMSDDDKHRLYHAATMSGDKDLVTQVEQKLGLFDANKKPTPAHDQFKKEHKDWVKQNAAWVKEYKDRKKAKEYVNSHLS